MEPAENEISEEAYMDWYYNITKLKIIPPSRATKNPAVYQQARDKCDVSKAMDLVCLNIAFPFYCHLEFIALCIC